MTLLDYLARVRPEEDLAEAVALMRAEVARRTRRATRSDQAPRRCPTCGLVKTAADFNRTATRADGLDWRCRACMSARRRRPGRVGSGRVGGP